MTTEEIQSALQHIEQEADPNLKSLLLAALISEEFRAAGFEPVVVGGSAIEFYTDGAYMSGDTDICWKGAKVPTPVEKAAVLALLGDVSVDWTEVDRLAQLPAYRCAEAVQQMKLEVAKTLEESDNAQAGHA